MQEGCSSGALLEPSHVSLVCHLTIRAKGAARNTIIRVDNSSEKQLQSNLFWEGKYCFHCLLLGFHFKI